LKKNHDEPDPSQRPHRTETSAVPHSGQGSPAGKLYPGIAISLRSRRYRGGLANGIIT